MPATSRCSSAKRLDGAEVSDSVGWVSLLVSMRADTLPRDSDIGKKPPNGGKLFGLLQRCPRRRPRPGQRSVATIAAMRSAAAAIVVLVACGSSKPPEGPKP